MYGGTLYWKEDFLPSDRKLGGTLDWSKGRDEGVVVRSL